jgi:hypothetical protein
MAPMGRFNHLKWGELRQEDKQQEDKQIDKQEYYLKSEFPSYNFR